MATYANGKAPDTALAFVDGIHLAPDVGRAFNAFQQDAAEQGVELHVARPYGGYRNRVEQLFIYNQGATGGSSVKPASPGYSTHGNYTNGRVDIVGPNNRYSDSLIDWLLAHASRYGLVQEFGNADRNHFKATGAFSGGPSTVISKAKPLIIPQEGNMFVIGCKDPNGSTRTYSIMPDGRVFWHEDVTQKEKALWFAKQPDVAWETKDGFNQDLWVLGLKYELDYDLVMRWSGPGFGARQFTPSWLRK